MNVRELEQAARIAWPALEEQELPFGVLRYASGSERRINALSLHPDVDLQPRQLIGAAEKFFGERNAAPVVRVVRARRSSPSMLAEVDRALASRGYEKQSPTLTMLFDLASRPRPASSPSSEVERMTDLDAWLHAWYALSGKPLGGMALHSTILRKLEPTQLRLVNRALAGLPLSTGMAVHTGRAVGIFGIATATDRRQQGHASTVLSSLLQWAFTRGASFAYLQVEESNEAAIRLYRKLGFKEFYSYWYRVGKTNLG